MYDRYTANMGYDATVSPDPVTTPDPALRSLYDSDISNDQKAKFAEVAIRHYGAGLNSLNDNYYLVRVSQYEYRLYIGDVDLDGTINACDVYTLRGITSGYSTSWTWSKVSVSTGSVDLDGSAAYIYSSYDPYPALPSVTQAKTGFVLCFAACACICLACIVSLGCLIRGWFKR